MPIAIVRYHRKLEAKEDFFAELEFLAMRLPAIIAEALNTSHPDGQLMPADINVRFERSGPFDQNVIDLSILILANDYPERRANIKERKEAIVGEVRQMPLADNADFSVWILLAEGAYGADIFSSPIVK